MKLSKTHEHSGTSSKGVCGKTAGREEVPARVPESEAYDDCLRRAYAGPGIFSCFPTCEWWISTWSSSSDF
jgi:hypothetical protein